MSSFIFRVFFFYLKKYIKQEMSLGSIPKDASRMLTHSQNSDHIPFRFCRSSSSCEKGHYCQIVFMAAASARVYADGNAQLKSENSALHSGRDEGKIYLGPQRRTHKNQKINTYIRRLPWVKWFNSALVNFATQRA